MTEIVPQTSEAASAKVEEVGVEVVGLVGYVPQAGEAEWEEQNDERFPLDRDDDLEFSAGRSKARRADRTHIFEFLNECRLAWDLYP